jgi:hypothetical protein
MEQAAVMERAGRREAGVAALVGGAVLRRQEEAVAFEHCRHRRRARSAGTLLLVSRP